MMAPPQHEDSLRDALAELPVEEILALCFTFASNRDRLRLYLDVLRHRGGLRAQFAATMICFDLGRQGHTSFQREFELLAETVRSHADDLKLVQSLLREDPYLNEVWHALKEALQNSEQIDFLELNELEDDTSIELDLFSADELQELEAASLELQVDYQELKQRLDTAVTDYLGGQDDRPIYDPTKGFRLRSRQDEERFELFFRTLESVRDLIPNARGYRALAMLFYGTCAKRRGLFGANPKKDSMLQAGIEAFVANGPEMATIAGVFNPLHADSQAWPQIADILLEYVAWLSRTHADANTSAKPI